MKWGPHKDADVGIASAEGPRCSFAHRSVRATLVLANGANRGAAGIVRVPKTRQSWQQTELPP